MVTEQEYIRAKEIIKKYEDLQAEINKPRDEIISKFPNKEDVELTKILSVRTKNVLKMNVEYNYFKQFGKFYLSDLILIVKLYGFASEGSQRRGFLYGIIKFRNSGKVTYNEIMSYVSNYI